MLKLRFKNNKHNAVWLVEPKVTLGRASSNDVVLEDPEAGDLHAEILVKHEQLTLVNLSGKPLRVNNRLVNEKVELKVEDQLVIGKTSLEVIDPKAQARPVSGESTGWALKANHAALSNRVFPIKAETVIGRSRECDISLGAAHLSRRHVKLFVQEGLLYLRDLGSANGTYLNGARVTEARVRRGDELRFDSLRFGVIGPPSEDLDKTTIRRIAARPAPSQTAPVQARPQSLAPAPSGAQQASRSAASGKTLAERREAGADGLSEGQGKRGKSLGVGVIALLALAFAAGLALQQWL